MDIEQLQDSICRLNNEERTYAILVKINIYEMLMARSELLCEKNPLMTEPIASYYGVIVKIDNDIDSDFKALTKKEYDEWKETKCQKSEV